MEGKRTEEIRKGPWKAEEDQVLINHVKKYGPRDWSSIRSKGLLQRTGKSCRLRWVNKLRPNLKNGCKFSLEEEKIVIELQAEFGNKWARIATYLPGRTDNDVKNFWSSRQKRLARILQNSTTPSSSSYSKPQRITNRDVANLEAPNFSSSMEEKSSSKPQSCSSSTVIDNSETIKMISLPDLVNPKLLRLDPLTNSYYQNPSTDQSLLQVPFAQIPPQDLTVSPDSQELLSRLGDPYCFDIFGPSNPSPLLVNDPQLPVEERPMTGCSNVAKDGDNEEIVNLDIFFDDFPVDMFDHVEPLPSPSEW